MINTRGMYLRPGNLFKDFEIIMVEAGIKNGTPIEEQRVTGQLIRGCLEEAGPDDKIRWDQPQHPVTHSIVQTGSPQASPGWILRRFGKNYHIHGIDSCGDLGIACIYYVEERSDSGA